MGGIIKAVGNLHDVLLLQISLITTWAKCCKSLRAYRGPLPPRARRHRRTASPDSVPSPTECLEEVPCRHARNPGVPVDPVLGQGRRDGNVAHRLASGRLPDSSGTPTSRKRAMTARRRNSDRDV